MRIRLDWLVMPYLPYDFKTTSGSASDAVWSRRAWETGLDLQDSLYCRGLQRFFELDHRLRMTFIVQETKPPYALAVHRLSNQAAEYADQRIDRAIRTWKHCLENDHWPGYPPYVNEIDPPPWKLAQEEERRVVEDLRKINPDWQAPV